MGRDILGQVIQRTKDCFQHLNVCSSYDLSIGCIDADI